MKAGQLRNYVDVQRKVLLSTGSRGESAYQWETVYSRVPARVQTLTSSTVGEAKKVEITRQLVPLATHQVTIRYLSGLTESMRFVFNGLVLNIGMIADKENLHFTQDVYCVADMSDNGRTVASTGCG